MEKILQANQGFYRAFESLEISKMEEVWLRGDEVGCVHPGWALLGGWEAVMDSWARIFENATMMQFNTTGVEAALEGDLAWVKCTENLTSLLDGRINEGKVQSINIFRRHDGRWLMVYHHGSPVM